MDNRKWNPHAGLEYNGRMHLDSNDFSRIIVSTPLVAIDLIVRNERGEVLLGYRRNRPAQHFWFVPGGRIRKNERLHDALQRVACTELGVVPQEGQLLGVFDHLYEDNTFGLPGVDTHYVVIGWQCALRGDDALVSDAQHAALRWWSVAELLASEEVHLNTKRYFLEMAGDDFRSR